MTEDEWPTERYPPWAHGAGYVLSKDLVTEIAAGAAQKASNHRMFKLEDIAMGSWIEFIAEEKNWKLELVRAVFLWGCCFSGVGFSGVALLCSGGCCFSGVGF